MFLAESERLLEQVALDIDEKLSDPVSQHGHRHRDLVSLVWRIAADSDDLGILDVLRPYFDPERNATQLPFGELPARSFVSFVQRHAYSGIPQYAFDLFGFWQHSLAPVVAPDRNDDHLVRRHPRRQHQATIIPMHHDDGADQPCRDAPRRAPHVLNRFVAALEGNV